MGWAWRCSAKKGAIFRGARERSSAPTYDTTDKGRDLCIQRTLGWEGLVEIKEPARECQLLHGFSGMWQSSAFKSPVSVDIKCYTVLPWMQFVGRNST